MPHLFTAVASVRPVVESLERRALLASVLDLSFGEVGLAKHAMGRFVDIIPLPRERMLAFGESGGVFGSTGQPLVGRIAVLRPDGTLDTAFGGTGTRRITKFGVTAAAVQADGKILLAGRSPGEDRIAVARLNPDGSYDTTFGTRGVHVGADLGTQPGASVAALTIAQGGKIQLIVQSNKPDGSSVQIDVFRYSRSGKPDTTFGPGGRRLLMDNAIIHRARAMYDGRTIVAGQPNPGFGPSDTFVLRVLNDGTIDNAFYSRGLGDDIGTVLDIDQQADNKIVLAAGSSLVRLNTNGRLDTTFSDDGVIELAEGELASGPSAVAVQSDGKIVTTAYIAGSGVYAYDGYYRFNPDGTPDETFGPSGHITEPGDPRGRWTTLQPTADGNLIAAGNYAMPNWHIQQLDESPDVWIGGQTLYVRGGEGDDLVTLERDPADSDMATLIFNQTRTSYAVPQVRKVVVFTGRGNDAIQVGLDVPVHVNAGEGNDTVVTAGGGDSIRSGGGVDSIFSGAGNDTLTGGGGGGGEAIEFDAGSGDDLLFEVRAASITGGEGNDTMTGVFGDTVRGGAGDDRIERAGGAVFGDDGNDLIIGASNVNGGAGNDIITLQLPVPGNDGTLSEDDPPLILRGGPGNDLLSASGRNFELHGDDGDDEIRVSAFHIPGDPDLSYDDSVTGRSRAFGGEGNDTMFGGTGGNHLEGNAGNDRIYIPSGYASGGGGRDRLVGQAEAVRFNGGDGNDHLSAPGLATLIGGAGDDLLTGGTLLRGGDGRDTLVAALPRATLLGDAGDDTFFTRDGKIDTLDGGADEDTATVDALDVLTGIENVTA